MSDGAAESVTHWKLPALVSLHMRHWNEEWAVFDAGSGETHLVDTLTAMALIVLESGTSSREDIIDHVCRTFELTDPSDVSSRVDEVITSLCQSGLAEPVPP
jgi:PqqD family protein of HPr-rel-A system